MAKVNFIEAERNKSYGPPLVNQKYAPLENFSWGETVTHLPARLLQYRWALLKGAGLLPQPLTLVMPNWANAIASEAGKKPPLVVISTNHSQWIERAFNSVKGDTFDNVSDLRALTGYGDQKVSPPIYTPSRIGDAGPRNVYIVVNISEYKTYKTKLAGFADQGVRVVGWSFRTPRASEYRLCGFGPSRFAAIEFCKTLRTEAHDPWDYAWLFDDNVVALTTFPGFGAVEKAMDDADSTHVCAGFKGGTLAEFFPAARTFARSEITEGRGTQTAELGKSEDKGLVQQAALWNIAYLTDNHLNFGPIFLESGEDVSLAHYFNYYETPYFFYEGIGVYKEDAPSDTTKGGKSLKTARAELTAFIAEGEGSSPTPLPATELRPPPFKIKPKVAGGDKKVKDRSEQLVSEFVVKTVLPNASAATQAEAGKTDKQNTAKCQAVELTICKALEEEFGIDEDALEQTFNINKGARQVVNRVDKP